VRRQSGTGRVGPRRCGPRISPPGLPKPEWPQPRARRCGCGPRPSNALWHTLPPGCAHSPTVPRPANPAARSAPAPAVRKPATLAAPLLSGPRTRPRPRCPGGQARQRNSCQGPAGPQQRSHGPAAHDDPKTPERPSSAALSGLLQLVPTPSIRGNPAVTPLSNPLADSGVGAYMHFNSCFRVQT